MGPGGPAQSRDNHPSTRTSYTTSNEWPQCKVQESFEPGEREMKRIILIVALFLAACGTETATRSSPAAHVSATPTAVVSQTPTSTPTPTPTPTPTQTPVPTPPPAAAPAPPPPPPPAPKNLCGAPSNPWGFNFCGGATITSPPGNFCQYFNCIGNFWNGRGYVIECQDGTYSKSGGIRGSCSYHGGDLRPLYQ